MRLSVINVHMYGTSHRNFNSSSRSVSRSVHGRSGVSRRNHARDVRIVAQMISECDLSEFARFFLICSVWFILATRSSG